MSTNNFLMQIEDVFSITGRGTVITGIIKSGVINSNDTVYISGNQYIITGIEKNRQLVSSARANEAVGLLIKGVPVNQFHKGDIVTGNINANIDDTLFDNSNTSPTCKSCGGNVTKDGSVYICSQCGEVFKDENAVERGNVTINTKIKNTINARSSEMTERLNNLYSVARRAKEDHNDEQAEKYYDMILFDDPNSWEAVYYTTYFNVIQSKIGQISHAADKLGNCLNSVFNLIDEYVPSGEEAQAISEVFTKTKEFAHLLHDNARSHYMRFKDTSGSSTEYLSRCSSVYYLLCELGDQLEKRYSNNPAIGHMCATAWKDGIQIRLNSGVYTEESKHHILSYAEKIKKYDPSYDGVRINNGGCYVATCVYGSYDCPEVWTLRRFRDYTLDETWYGRAFIKTYYAISPTLVQMFGGTQWFKKMWKKRLDKMVKKLNDKGFDNTKYIDKY